MSQTTGCIQASSLNCLEKGKSGWFSVIIAVSLISIVACVNDPNVSNGRVLEITLSGIPADVQHLQFSMMVDGQYAEVRVDGRLDREQFNFPLPSEVQGEIHVNVVAFNSECSTGAAQGTAPTPVEVNPTTLSLRLGECTSCWCPYCLGESCKFPSNTLSDVWGTSPTEAWALGQKGTVLHWDGAIWTQEPAVTDIKLSAFAGTGPDDIWVAGGQFDANNPDDVVGALLHWDGMTWTKQVAPKQVLYSAALAPSGELWLAGGCGEGNCSYVGVRQSSGDILEKPIPATQRASFLGQVLHDSLGRTWAVGGIGKLDPKDPTVRCPAMGPIGRIFSVDGVGAWQPALLPSDDRICNLWRAWEAGPNDIWVVGEYGTILHWDGKVWKSARDLFLPQRTLWHIWGANPSDIWAVGGSGGQGLMVHWDGTAWSEVNLGTLLEKSRYLFGVWGTSQDDVWAVGSAGTILRYQRISK